MSPRTPVTHKVSHWIFSFIVSDVSLSPLSDGQLVGLNAGLNLTGRVPAMVGQAEQLPLTISLLWPLTLVLCLPSISSSIEPPLLFVQLSSFCQLLALLRSGNVVMKCFQVIRFGLPLTSTVKTF